MPRKCSSILVVFLAEKGECFDKLLCEKAEFKGGSAHSNNAIPAPEYRNMQTKSPHFKIWG